MVVVNHDDVVEEKVGEYNQAVSHVASITRRSLHCRHRIVSSSVSGGK